ncbi:MAG: hypothetical protein AAF638_05125 [Pseudomonadota bacterium]
MTGVAAFLSLPLKSWRTPRCKAVMAAPLPLPLRECFGQRPMCQHRLSETCLANAAFDIFSGVSGKKNGASSTKTRKRYAQSSVVDDAADRAVFNTTVALPPQETG